MVLVEAETALVMKCNVDGKVTTVTIPELMPYSVHFISPFPVRQQDRNHVFVCGHIYFLPRRKLEQLR